MGRIPRGRSGRRGRGRIAQTLGSKDPRVRRNAQLEREPTITVGGGLKIDSDGRIAIDPLPNIAKTTGSGPIHVQFNALIDALIERGFMQP